MKLNYLTEKEAGMALNSDMHLILFQLVHGLQTCETKGEAVKLIEDAVELGRRQGRKEKEAD